MTRSSTIQAIAQSHFLILGYGNELQGDDAVGLRVANVVAKWRLPSVKAIAINQITPEIVNELVATDYVIFVDACNHNSCARTVQIDPIVVGCEPSRTLPQKTHGFNPQVLLNLTQQLYGQSPQAWLLQVPIETLDFSEQLSSTAKRGCDRAVRTIEQFLKTYQQPAWTSHAVYMKSA